MVRGWDSVCTSRTVQVTVLCHGDRPYLTSAIGNADQSTIRLVFNDTLDMASAQNVTNYAISGGLSITNASIVPTLLGSEVLLTTSALRDVGHNYTLTVRNVRDDSLCGNVIYPNPTVVTLTQDIRLLPFDAVWRYHNEGQDLGTEWRSTGFDDSAWPSGPGAFGFDPNPLFSYIDEFIRTPLRRTNSLGTSITTDYFRTLVTIPFDCGGVTFNIRHAVDDGAIFYFNGVEVARFNMPTGEVNYATTAVIAPAEGVIRTITNLTGLAYGLNSVAVEVHQQGAASADVLFGAELIARVPKFVGRLEIMRNSDRTLTISWAPASGVLQEAVDVAGPWADVTGAASPLRIAVPAGRRFYRLRGF